VPASFAGYEGNSELAHLLAFVSTNYGDWRKLFTALDDGIR
jgi:hypothetical protein